MTKDNKTRRRVTQYDIARMLGISQTTVSQVLSNRATSNIPAETRQRIIETAKELGYIPDRIARSLRTGKSYLIAAVIPDITNPFFPALVRGIQDVAESYAYQVVTYNTDGRADKEQQILQLIQQVRVDGLILAPFHLSVELLHPLLERHIPTVLLSDPVNAPELKELPFDSVGHDALAQAETAVSYLVSRGHRRIAMISSDLAPAGVTRVQGYQQALARHQLEFEEQLLIWSKDFTEPSGYEGMQVLAALKPLPTALFLATDQLALGALRAAKELEIAVPGELAIMGIDDISPAELVSPALTTVRQLQQQQGRLAAQLLFERINQSYEGPGRHIAMPYELIVRESA